ncbi:MAG TPA: glycosyltransferase family 2 protein [Thermoanaerobaculia bacterium]|nr:glycosyltransferase family 2 protein [Thermoanaerobaculia bacterium]
MSERVCAVVVTYNRKHLLADCLRHLLLQQRRPEEILIVDNASTDGTAELVRAEFPELTLLELPANVGGSGGFHAGMQWAHARKFDWLWLMDDDANAAPDCLAKLLAVSADADVVVPLQQDKLGRFYGVTSWESARGKDVTADVVAGRLPETGAYLFAFVGPLISRRMVDEVGLPNKDFFIWFDDLEYALRIEGRNGRVRIVREAVMSHDMGGALAPARFLWRKSFRATPPPWKTYYGTRNPLFFMIEQRRPARELMSYLLHQQRGYLADLAYGPQRWQRFRMRTKGIIDGLFGRLGRRVTP